MSKALEVVLAFRDKAIAILRLTKVNALAEDLQITKSRVKELTASLADTNKKIAEVSSGEFSPSYDDMQTYKTADEARNAVLERLNKSVEELNKGIVDSTKSVTDLTAKINDVSSGKKAFARETITSLTNELIKRDGTALSLEELGAVDESGNEDNFEAKVA